MRNELHNDFIQALVLAARIVLLEDEVKPAVLD
jgi:hypothetical protein